MYCRAPSGAPGRLLEHDERVALVDRLALLAQDLAHDAAVLGLDRHLHLHGLEDHDGVALGHRGADLALDLPDRARDVGLDLRHAVLLRDIRPTRGSARGPYPRRWTATGAVCPSPWPREAPLPARRPGVPRTRSSTASRWTRANGGRFSRSRAMTYQSA